MMEMRWMKITVFWDVASCSLVEIDRRFIDAYCHLNQGHDHPDDGGIKNLWNVGQFLPHNMTQRLKRQPYSYSSPCEPEESPRCVVLSDRQELDFWVLLSWTSGFRYSVDSHIVWTIKISGILLTNLTPWRQNAKIHHRIHKSPPPVPILSLLDPMYSPANLPKIHSDPILPSTPWSSKWSLYFWLSHQNPVHIPLLSHACYMPRPPHSPWFDLPNNIWGGVQNMKLLIVQLPPFSRHLIPLRSKYSP
jgi:hypothetical protein